MSAMTQRCHRLADSLEELKVKVRTALATELAGAVGLAVRDVLVAALIERILPPMRPTVRPATPSRPDRWDDEARDRWLDPDETNPLPARPRGTSRRSATKSPRRPRCRWPSRLRSA